MGIFEPVGMLSLLSLSKRVTISSCVHSSSCCCCSSTIFFINTSTSIAPSTNWRRPKPGKGFPYSSKLAMWSKPCLILTSVTGVPTLERTKHLLVTVTLMFKSARTVLENNCLTHLLSAVLMSWAMGAMRKMTGWRRPEGVTSSVVGFRVYAAAPHKRADWMSMTHEDHSMYKFSQWPARLCTRTHQLLQNVGDISWNSLTTSISAVYPLLFYLSVWSLILEVVSKMNIVLMTYILPFSKNCTMQCMIFYRCKTTRHSWYTIEQTTEYLLWREQWISQCRSHCRISLKSNVLLVLILYADTVWANERVNEWDTGI